MKQFWKYVLATIVGSLIMIIVVVALGVISIAGIVSADEAAHSAKDNSVLVLTLNGAIGERTQDNPLASLLGDSFGQTGLNDILSAIKKAAANDKIKGIYIKADMMSTGYGTLQEIRNALIEFKSTGKWIIAYGDAYTQGAYYVASVADKVYLNPSGELGLHGIATQQMFVKDLYEKFGIRFQIIKVGKYKSATEMYSEDRMSDANREQVTAFVEGIWDNITSAIAASRNISKDSVNAFADRFTEFIPQTELVSTGLVDSLSYGDGVKEVLKQRLGLNEDDEINQLSVADMRTVKGERKRGDKIAVYYAEGSIIDSEIESMPSFGSSQIVGTKVCDDLDKLITDDDVKAVVLRVNSPGGSAYASEQIWHKLARLKEKKPVVVSMGDYAASGGYYISCGASWIVAQPTTLTGSVGIFGVIPEGSELLTKKLSLHFDGVKTNRHADLGASVYSIAVRPLSAEETDLMQSYIERGYSLFRQRVADGRKQTAEQIEAIAQGHVWLGQDALGIKLVDQLGGLDDAIKKAAQLAKLDNYYTEDYPEEESWYDMLFSSESNNIRLEDRLKGVLGDWYLPFMCVKTASEQAPVQAMMPYFISFN
ncbi:MAG: signal peptide peptidase SppA [Prevotella sp.]|nr:signal peptide peptidase SppA [Prevotella sp.]